MKKENRAEVKKIDKKIEFIEKWIEGADVYFNYTATNKMTVNGPDMKKQFLKEGIVDTEADFNELMREILTMKKLVKGLFAEKLKQIKENLENSLEDL